MPALEKNPEFFARYQPVWCWTCAKVADREITFRWGGRLGFIVPNTILTQEFYEELRAFILESCLIEQIVTFADLPFKDAVVENVILILRKCAIEQQRSGNQVEIVGISHELKFTTRGRVPQSGFQQAFKKTFGIQVDASLLSLKSKLENGSVRLGEVLYVNQAIALKHDRAEYLDTRKRNNSYKPVLDGRNIQRYSLDWDGTYLRYDISAIHSSKNEQIFLTDEKIFFRRVGEGLIGTLDTEKFYALNTLVVMNKKKPEPPDIRYYLGLFNSKLMNFYYASFLKSTTKVFSEIQARQVEQLPLRIGSVDDQSSMVKKVDRILSLHKERDEVGPLSDQGKELGRKISELDRDIDSLAYKIYGLSEDEARQVERAMEAGGESPKGKESQ